MKASTTEIQGVPAEAVPTVKRLTARASDDLTGVAEAVSVHLDHLRGLSRDELAMDLVLATQVANGLRQLIEWGEQAADPAQRRLIWVAAEYFMCGHDASPDIAVESGFVDDAQVFNAVAGQLGRDDFRLAL